LVEVGNVFHARITIQCSVPSEKKNIVIAIGDTVLVDSNGEPNVLTKDISKKFSAISYTFDDDDEKDDSAPKEKVKKNAIYHLGASNGASEGINVRSRTR
jgi:nucleosome binding factor SPN SPT16 subunit